MTTKTPAQVHVNRRTACGNARLVSPLGVGERGVQGYPGTARYGCTRDARSAGRSSLRSFGDARPPGITRQGPGLGFCTESGTPREALVSMPPTTVEPSESAFTGQLCVIGMVAAAPLTGDDCASEAHHPHNSPGRTAARGEVGGDARIIGRLPAYGAESAGTRFSPRASVVLAHLRGLTCAPTVP